MSVRCHCRQRTLVNSGRAFSVITIMRRFPESWLHGGWLHDKE